MRSLQGLLGTIGVAVVLLLVGHPVLATTQDPYTASQFPAALDCSKIPGNDNAGAALDAVMKAYKIVPGRDDIAWANSTLAAIAPFGKLPSNPAAQAVALRTIALAHIGLVVAAQISNDDGRATVADYRISAISHSIQTFLNTLVTPDADEDGGGDSDKGDLASSSRQLKLKLQQVSDVKVMLGPAYQLPSVRYYILSHSFDDVVGARASEASICALGLHEDVKQRISLAADYMKSKH